MANDGTRCDSVLRAPSVSSAIRSGEVSSLAGPARRRRSILRLIALACLLLIAAGIGGLPVYVRPQIDRLRHADAIFILGGYGNDRYSYGLELAMQGWASNVVVSNPRGNDDPWLTDYCATRYAGLALKCFSPDPPTTKGEGRELAKLAAQHGWQTVIVVTFPPHLSRARFILERCFDGDLVMVASPDRLSAPKWAFEYLYQTAGYARAVVQPGC
jgi:uncharacterized SAM-binding protein YcdF (DUF218 family)